MNSFRSILLILILFLGQACKKELDPSILPVDVKVLVGYAPSIENYAFPIKGIEVTLKNTYTTVLLTAFTDASGVASFPNVDAGTYNMQARTTVKSADYQDITGVTPSTDVVITASAPNQLVSAKLGGTLSLLLNPGSIGDWVIKQIYYAGSNQTSGASYRDQFIEIHNNSNHILYADSLYLAQLQGVKATGISSEYLLPATRQYDWSKALNMQENLKSTANTDYVYAQTLLMIPGTGQQYPVAPGESIVIAQTAQNHKASFVGTDGKTISVKTPALTVNLSTANFEAVYASLLAKPLDSDVDNPAVPNVVVLNYTGSDFILDVSGKDAFAIFRTREDVRQWGKYATPPERLVTALTPLNVQIPRRLLIDGVEIQPGLSELYPKKLPTDIDASYSFVPRGSYSSQSLIRKTAKTLGSRRVLQDLNDSSKDFDFLDPANPKGFK